MHDGLKYCTHSLITVLLKYQMAEHVNMDGWLDTDQHITLFKVCYLQGNMVFWARDVLVCSAVISISAS